MKLPVQAFGVLFDFCMCITCSISCLILSISIYLFSYPYPYPYPYSCPYSYLYLNLYFIFTKIILHQDLYLFVMKMSHVALFKCVQCVQFDEYIFLQKKPPETVIFFATFNMLCCRGNGSSYNVTYIDLTFLVMYFSLTIFGLAIY